MADRRPLVGPSQFSELVNTDSLVFGVSIVLAEQGASPSTPANGYGIIYCKSDGNLYFKNDSGTETQLN